MRTDFTKKERRTGNPLRLPLVTPLFRPEHRAGTGTRPCTRIILSLLSLFFYVVPCSAQTDASKRPPRVLFITHPEADPSDDALFTAIRAQLAVSSLTIERVAPTLPEATASALNTIAAHLAREHHADLVFWIEDKDPCQIHFFVPDNQGGQFSSRTVEVDSSRQTGRYDVIAVVAAVTIEGLIVQNPPALPSTPTPQQQAPSVKTVKAEARPRRFELQAAYAGALTANKMPTHGGILGVGAFPVRRLFLAVSFSLFAPTSFSNEALQIRLISRQLEVQAAVRLFPSSLEIRLGVSYCADFRSYSTTALDDTIRARDDGFNAVHAFVPFLFAAWTYRDRIGLFGKVGASLAVNETVYRIHRVSGEYTEEMAPFDAKLIYQFGLLVRL